MAKFERPRMKSNWIYRIGVTLFFGLGLAFMSGSLAALGVVAVSCIGCLLAGYFRYAVSNLSIIQLFIYAILTVFLIGIAGRALFVVVESLMRDTSADVYVGRIIFVSWLSVLAALGYGMVNRVRMHRSQSRANEG